MHADFSFSTLDDEPSPTIRTSYFDEHVHLKISHPHTGNVYFILSLDETKELQEQLNIALMDRDYHHGEIPQ